MKITIVLLLTTFFLLSTKNVVMARKMTDIKPNPAKMTDSKQKPPKMTEMTGIASYYSTTGCLGCSPTLTMANGEKLDDNRLTIALPPDLVTKNNLLNTYVGIINLSNYQTTIAKVTDTGGFKKLGRIADLSLETKKQLNCSSLCKILILY